MKLEITPLLDKLTEAGAFLRRYLVPIVFVAVVGIYGGLVWYIGQLAQKEPSQTAIDEKLQTIKRPRFDQASLNKLQQLESENVQVETLFEQARKNPFQD